MDTSTAKEIRAKPVDDIIIDEVEGVVSIREGAYKDDSARKEKGEVAFEGEEIILMKLEKRRKAEESVESEGKAGEVESGDVLMVPIRVEEREREERDPIYNVDKESMVSRKIAIQYTGKRRRSIPWSLREEESLYKGLKLYGVGEWAKIKEEFKDVFVCRTGVDIKDKYRTFVNKTSYGRKERKRFCLLDGSGREVYGEDGQMVILHEKFPCDAAYKGIRILGLKEGEYVRLADISKRGEEVHLYGVRECTEKSIRIRKILTENEGKERKRKERRGRERERERSGEEKVGEGEE